jgi:hydrogenase nickel incorporation protein HypA/HybF
MHEFSIADELLKQVLSVADQNGADVVGDVILEVGKARLIIPEVMLSAWEGVTRDTIAEGSRLILEEVDPAARCRRCGREFSVEIDNYLCPDCEIADCDLLRGNDIILKSVVLDQDDDN